jgi:hypothetical protein
LAQLPLTVTNKTSNDMKKETESILQEFKKGTLSLDKAQRQLFVLFGVSKSASCRLDRLPTECSIYLYTSGKDCKLCGHYC